MPALVQHGRKIGVLEEPDAGPALTEGDGAAGALGCVAEQGEVETAIRRSYVLIEGSAFPIRRSTARFVSGVGTGAGDGCGAFVVSGTVVVVELAVVVLADGNAGDAVRQTRYLICEEVRGT